MNFAPFAQGLLGGPGFEIVPLVERAPPRQQVLKGRIGTSPAEDAPDLVEIVRQEFARKVEHERLAEIELSLIGNDNIVVAVFKIIRQRLLIVLVQSLRMFIDLPGPPTNEGLMLAHAVEAGEHER